MRAITTILRLEGGLALAAAILAYRYEGGTWLLFGVLFLVPDITMAGYVGGPRIGAIIYNLGHTYAAPAALTVAGYLTGIATYDIALIWAGHIGFDRGLGYGLKYPTGFGATHLA